MNFITKYAEILVLRYFTLCFHDSLRYNFAFQLWSRIVLVTVSGGNEIPVIIFIHKQTQKHSDFDYYSLIKIVEVENIKKSEFATN